MIYTVRNIIERREASGNELISMIQRRLRENDGI